MKSPLLKNSRKQSAVIALAILSLTACNVGEKLSEVGSGPSLSKIEDPQAQAGYTPVSMPMPTPQPVVRNPNSLWRTGSRAFFNDQRAARVGDLVNIVIAISDKAKLADNSEATRGDPKGGDQGNLDIAGMPALPPYLSNVASMVLGPNGIAARGNSHLKGQGSIERSEDITVKLAANVIQVLPNGNFVINGTQQVRVNTELRELTITGVIRPSDIDSTNMITYDKIAEARISYGGRGLIADVNRRRYGSELLDAILPF